MVVMFVSNVDTVNAINKFFNNKKGENSNEETNNINVYWFIDVFTGII